MPFLLHISPFTNCQLLNIAVSVNFLQQATVVALISCLIVLLVILAFVLVRRVRRRMRVRFQQLFRHWLADAIKTRVFESNNNHTISAQLQKLLHKGQYRLLALEELLICKKYLKGNAMNIVVQLYEQLQLRAETNRKLQSSIWSRVVKGIQEIYIFDQYDAMDQLFAFADNPNPFIRAEAHFGVVNLQGFDALVFLKQIRNNLSDWDQINLLHQLSLFEPKPLLEMPAWLQLENESAVVFALKLLEAYPDQQYYEQLMACLNHPNDNIRQQAIACTAIIYQANTSQLLQQQFEQEKINLQLAILQTMQLLPTAPDQEFLTCQLQHADDRIKQLAAELLCQKFSHGLALIQETKMASDKKQQQLIKHVEALA